MDIGRFDYREQEPQHEGERYLELLGLGHLAGHTIFTAKGPVQLRDFLDICGKHARPLLSELNAMDPSDPEFPVARDAIRDLVVSQYIGEDGMVT
jgi:hypothetical protein